MWPPGSVGSGGCRRRPGRGEPLNPAGLSSPSPSPRLLRSLLSRPPWHPTQPAGGARAPHLQPPDHLGAPLVDVGRGTSSCLAAADGPMRRILQSPVFYLLRAVPGSVYFFTF